MLLCGELVLDEVLEGSGLGGSLLEAGLDFLNNRKAIISIESLRSLRMGHGSGKQGSVYRDVATNVTLDGGEGRGLEVVEDEHQRLASLDELLGRDLVLSIDRDVSEGLLERWVLEVGNRCVGHVECWCG